MPEGREIGVGVIGMGWMGQVHARACRRLTHHYPDLGIRPRLVAAADPSAERRALAEEALGFARTSPDWRELLEDPEIGAISVTTPNFLHAEMGVAVAEAGKHLWIEKPAGRGLAETLAIKEAADRAAVHTAVGFDYRLAPAVDRARELVASGAIGEVHTYYGRFLGDYAASPDVALSWRFRRESAGSGVLGDLMCHVVDTAIFMAGGVEEVVADEAVFVPTRPIPADEFQPHFASTVGAERGPVENEDHVLALVRFASGAKGILECGRTVVGRRCGMGFEIYGSEGAIAWDFERMGELELYRLEGRDNGFRQVLSEPGQGDYSRFQPGPAIAMGYDDLKVIEASRFFGGIHAGQAQPPSMEDMVEAARVVEAFALSASSGGWVKVKDADQKSVEGF
jgi:predicted dehydrogenase